MRRLRSVRARLTLWYSCGLLAILLMYAGGVYVFVSHSLFVDQDHMLSEDLEVAAQMLMRSPDGRILWRDPRELVDPAEDRERRIQVYSMTGSLLFSTLPPNDPLGSLPPSATRSVGFRSLPVSGRGVVRVIEGPRSLDGVPVILRVSHAGDATRDTLRRLLAVQGLVLPLAVGAAALGGWFLARRALAPVEAMGTHARVVAAEHLHERLPVENPDDELGRLALTLNEMLARLEASFDELRRFTADASHELRTPLTAIRSVGEVGLRGDRGGDEYREIIGSMLEEADRLTQLLDSLLTLTRGDGGRLRIDRRPTDVVRMAEEVAALLGALADEKGQVVSVAAEGPVEALLDPIVFREALVNLVDNAIKYSPEKARIQLVVARRAREVTCEVRDEGPGIAAVHCERIFDRFYRIDKARSRDMGGSGLGLAIARQAVQAHGGALQLESREGEGSVFRISLPASAPEAS